MFPFYIRNLGSYWLITSDVNLAKYRKLIPEGHIICIIYTYNISKMSDLRPEENINPPGENPDDMGHLLHEIHLENSLSV